jgi:hypothetical protein
LADVHGDQTVRLVVWFDEQASRFVAAARAGDMSTLEQLFSDDVVSSSDTRC